MELLLKRKRFHPFKRHLYQNWKAENMPVVAVRLVFKNIPISKGSLYSGKIKFL